MEEDFKINNTRLFHRAFKSKVDGYTAPSLNFKRPDGTLALNNKDNCEILANYFEELLNCDAPRDKLEIEKNPIQNVDSEPPDEVEVRKVINSLKNNKASGEDGVVAELWKIANDAFIAETTKLFQNIWREEKIPEDWLVALIHPLHKKGPKTDVNNYRGISLLPVTYKIFSKLLLNRLEPQIDPKLGEYQGGFRKGRSCPEQILSLKMIIKYYTARPKNIYISFVDFKKAYDSIDRGLLMEILREYGVDQKTLNLIGLTLINTTSKVKFRGEISRPFQIRTGLRQGDGLSPTLFNVVLDKIMKTLWTKNNSGAVIGTKNKNVKIKCLAFADDLALLAETEQEAIAQIDELKEIAERVGLQISFTKTEMMSTNKDFRRRTVKTKYGRIKTTKQFKYLGETISNNGVDKMAIEDRRLKLERLSFATRNIYNKKNLSTNAKLRHYNAVVKPVILYGVETASLMNLEGLLKIERRILRKIYGPKVVQGNYRLRSNKEIYENMEDLETTIRKRRLKFYGHMARMSPARLNRQIFDKINILKSQGGYTKQMREELGRLGITNEDCQDRNQFRERLFNIKVLVGRERRREGGEWTDERRAQQSERMREMWRRRKEESARRQ
jgi:Reverse transcriptase (RNA-dependent DNA polymerase).